MQGAVELWQASQTLQPAGFHEVSGAEAGLEALLALGSTLPSYSMRCLDVLGRRGAIDVLRRLCIGEARFKELNEAIANTRTLSKRLKELAVEGLIQRGGGGYKITDEGFDSVLKISELEERAKPSQADYEELLKIRYGWMRISLIRLVELFHKEFGDELISIVLYGSILKSSFQPDRSDVDLLYVLQDGSRDAWQREGGVFKRFQSTWKYRAYDYWLKTRGFYGYPGVSAVSLMKSYAKRFQPVYLDMLSYRAVLYDREGFFQELMRKLGEALRALGTIRVEYPDGTYGWLLKPDIAPGESIEIDLG